MNQIGLHIGYWWGTGEEHDIFHMLDLSHQAEMDIMELNPIWLMKLSDKECVELLQRAKDYGMTLTLNGGFDASMDISCDDPEAREKGVQYCQEVLRRMPALEMNVWSGLNYSAWLRAPLPESDIMEEKKRAQDYSLDSLSKILPVAEELGVDYCFEVCNRFEQFLFNTAEEAVAFAQATGSDRAKAHLDTFHMNIEENNMADAIVYAGKAGKLGHIHVGESNRRIPGVGPTQIDWAAFGAAIKEAAYTGAIVMEPFVLTTAHNAKRTRTWRDLSYGASVEKLVEDAKVGGKFLRSVL